MKVPSAEKQIRFLNNIQRLFTEGGFTATYKYALLMALADLSVAFEPAAGATAYFWIEDICGEIHWILLEPHRSLQFPKQRRCHSFSKRES